METDFLQVFKYGGLKFMMQLLSLPPCFGISLSWTENDLDLSLTISFLELISIQNNTLPF